MSIEQIGMTQANEHFAKSKIKSSEVIGFLTIPFCMKVTISTKMSVQILIEAFYNNTYQW